MSAWIEQRRELYRHLRAHVGALLGSESKQMSLYRHRYEKEFQKKWKPFTREKLIHKIDEANLLFLADFHALQQSQKAHLRLLKTLNTQKKKILFVECIEAKYQDQLDAFLLGKISEKTFLKSVNWEKSWGFPWEHFKPIFDWAKKGKIPIFALNLKMDRLVRRDDFAAQIMAKVLTKFPNHQLVIIYGDQHLAKSHLPKSLLKINLSLKHKKMITIFQNSEKIYFDLLHKNKELSVDVVQISKNQFCLNSVPPWVKWQSYLLYIEGQYDLGLDGEALDYTDHVEKYLKLLCTDFGVKIESGAFSVYTANDDLLFEKIEGVFLKSKLKWFVSLIESSRNFYCPELDLAFLGRPSVNNAAHIAMAVLHAKLSGYQRSPCAMPDDFLKLIFLEAVQYFGSKMINPKRKTDTVIDIKATLTAHGAKGRGKEALSLALWQKLQEVVAVSVDKPFKIRRVKTKSSYYEAARLLGGMMGEKIYNGYRKKILSNHKILKLLKHNCDSEDFEIFYRRIVKEVEALPETFKSKREKI